VVALDDGDLLTALFAAYAVDKAMLAGDASGATVTWRCWRLLPHG
jgi:hypothetical protein